MLFEHLEHIYAQPAVFVGHVVLTAVRELFQGIIMVHEHIGVETELVGEIAKAALAMNILSISEHPVKAVRASESSSQPSGTMPSSFAFANLSLD